ncbi:hypothetical protein BC629DRAFT_783360 [Irpex lacteus]|nr:hypothetical protein BC629DRAFT_783360 [Irpex lacteus]
MFGSQSSSSSQESQGSQGFSASLSGTLRYIGETIAQYTGLEARLPQPAKHTNQSLSQRQTTRCVPSYPASTRRSHVPHVCHSIPATDALSLLFATRHIIIRSSSCPLPSQTSTLADSEQAQCPYNLELASKCATTPTRTLCLPSRSANAASHRRSSSEWLGRQLLLFLMLWRSLFAFKKCACYYCDSHCSTSRAPLRPLKRSRPHRGGRIAGLNDLAFMPPEYFKPSHRRPVPVLVKTPQITKNVRLRDREPPARRRRAVPLRSV